DDRLQRAHDLVAPHVALAEPQREREALLARLVSEHVVARPSLRALSLRLLRQAARVVARGAAVVLQAIDERDHFLRIALTYDLQQQRLRLDVGAPTDLTYVLRHRVEAQDLGDRRAALAQALRHRLVRVAVALGQRLEAVRLLEGAEVLALEVLHERDL